jgi:hypothetical protein
MKALRVLVAVMVVLFVTGCTFAGVHLGSGSSSPTPSSSTGPVYPDGWSKVDVTVSHFTIGLPDDWPRVRTDPKFLDSDMSTAKSQSASAASTFEAFTTSSGNFSSALVAADSNVNALFVAASYPSVASDTLDGVTTRVLDGFGSSSGSSYTRGNTSSRKIAVGPAQENKGTLVISGTNYDIVIDVYIEASSQKPRFYYAFIILSTDLSAFDTDFNTMIDTFRPVK